MINVFMVYSGADRDTAMELRDYIEQRTDINGCPANTGLYLQRHVNVISHARISTDWKKATAEKIKDADAILLVQSAKSESSPNVQWEIETAMRLKKPVMIYQISPCPVPKWMERHSFSLCPHTLLLKKPLLLDIPLLIPRVKREKRASVYTKKAIREELEQLDTHLYSVFSGGIEIMLEDRPQETEQQLFEQYKIYLQTSEELVAKRQAINEFYNTLNTAIVAFCGVIIAIENIPGTNKFPILLTMAIASVFFNTLWGKTLENYHILNTAKMRLINSIERQLPLRLFEAEYSIMRNRLYPWKYKATTAYEKMLPFLFSLLFFLLAVFSKWM